MFRYKSGGKQCCDKHKWSLIYAIEGYIQYTVIAVALLKAQICMISFQTCTQIFGIHKVLKYVKR